MAVQEKVYAGTSVTTTATTLGDYGAADNWRPISLTAGTLNFVASGSGTNEYYHDNSGDPGFAEPGNVQTLETAGYTNLVRGTAGSLNQGEWDYADNDTLGYSVIYVRLPSTAAAVDPDSCAEGYLTMTAIPAAGDDVTIPAGAQAISSGLNQSGVAINAFVVEPGYDAEIASNTGALLIDPDSFEFHGSKASYIDIGSANISPVIHRTASGSGSRPFGLNLTGSNIATLTTHQGTSVAIAGLANETSTVATWRNLGGTIYSGDGLSLTTLDDRGGAGRLRWTSAITTATQLGGTLRLDGTGTVTTFNLNGGTLTWTSGNITTLNQDAGTLDASKRSVAATIGTLNVNPAGQCVQLIGDLVTITTDNKPSDPYSRTYVRI